MHLDEITALIALVDHGSIKAAAEALGVPRTTVRRRLDDLEARAGVPLLHRHAGGATPTEGGRWLAERGRHLMRESDALLASVRDLGKTPSGRVRIAVPLGLPPAVLAGAAAALRAAFPLISVDLRFAMGPVADQIGEVDILLHLGAPLPEGPWLTFVVLRAHERLMASPAWLAKHGTPRDLADLQDLPLLVWDAPDRPSHALPLLSGGHLAIEPAIESRDIFLIRTMAHSGLGLALTPDTTWPEGSTSDVLVPVLPEIVGRKLEVRVVVPAAVANVPKVRAVVELVRQLGQAMPMAR